MAAQLSFSSDSSSRLTEMPILAEVDILIFGGTSAGVAFALEAHRLGRRVYLIAGRPYLGEDICGAYRFWPEDASSLPPVGGALHDEIFADPHQPPTPLHVKLTLEQNLVAQGIPFLLNSLPGGLLEDAEGRISGAVIANRTGRQAIRARLVVDATVDGQILALHAPESRHRLEGRQIVDFTTLCLGEGSDAPGMSTPRRLPGYAREGYSLSARRYEVEMDFGGGTADDYTRALNDLQIRCRVPEDFRQQTILRPRLAPASRPATLAELQITPGLLALTESVVLKSGSATRFARPDTAIADAIEIARAAVQTWPKGELSREVKVFCQGAERVPSGGIRALQGGMRRRELGSDVITFDPNLAPVLGEYDVVVVGGGTGGAPAGIAAARAGARTLILEATSALGGVGTVGQISRYWFGNRVGFTAEIDRGVAALETEEEFQKGNGAWSVAAKSFWYLKTAVEAGCRCWFNSLCVGVWLEGNRVRGLLVSGPQGYGLIKAGCVVDSTGCSDIPAAAGAATVSIGRDHVAVQGTGLGGIMPGREYRNTDHNFSDDTDILDATAFFVSSKLKFRGEFDCGELIDSRERRQIVGDASVTPLDILRNRRYPDTICVATSNFDSHGFTIDPCFMITPAQEHDALWADIPLRALLPQGLEGVLVTGLGVSAARDALPVIRMQPDVQNQGYAAGYIAALASREGRAIRDLDIREIQRHLVAVGNLPKRVLTDQDTFPLPESELRDVIENHWHELPGVALILHEPERCLPLLRVAYETARGESGPRSLRYAQLLAFLGDARGESEIIAAISREAWDQGWNYRGMGQFGMTVSPLDALVISLGVASGPAAWPCLLAKIATLPEDAEFSHYRALAMACEGLYARHPHHDAAGALASLLDRPGLTGHHQTSIAEAQRALSNDANDNTPRNLALRELHLARAIFRCGDDATGRGEAILQAYRRDLRGHFARHAAAVLEAGPGLRPSIRQPEPALAGA